MACAPKRKEPLNQISIAQISHCTRDDCQIPFQPPYAFPYLIPPDSLCSQYVDQTIPPDLVRTIPCKSSHEEPSEFCHTDLYNIKAGFYKLCTCRKPLSTSHIQTFWVDFCDPQDAIFLAFLKVSREVEEALIPKRRLQEADGELDKETVEPAASEAAEDHLGTSELAIGTKETSANNESAIENAIAEDQTPSDETASTEIPTNETPMNETSAVITPANDTVVEEDIEVPVYQYENNDCTTRADCNQFESCIDKRCAGFEPDLSDTNLIRCVDGYRCDVTPGQIAGHHVTTDFQVIGVSPAERCGLAQPLPTKLSIFANSNRWKCEDAGADGEYCAFSPGVGVRRNKTISLEGLRLCGCPASDLDGNGVLCDNEADFYVPLAKLGVQECLTNAHCLHKAFAYCVNDHCAGFMGVAASAGLRAYQCLLNKKCSVQSLAARALNEGLKVVPIATTFSCGAEQALDANYFNDAALPCVMDVNGDGQCDIHLGVARALGTNRLCGCNGKDLGGNGRPCDELADFDTDLGTLTVQECIVDQDCRQGMCIDTTCVLDTQSPYAVAIHPKNASIAVPPVTEIRITFNENIRFTKSGDRRFILTTMTESVKFEIPIQDPTLARETEAYRVSITGRDLIIRPDIRMTSLPEGTYLMGFEGGIVEDLQGNGNIGSTDFSFTISSTANCPFLGVTGFSVDNVNMNGVYRAATPLNGRARWTAVNAGDAALANTIFWRAPTAKLEGRWVIGFNYDDSKFLAYSDLSAGDDGDPSRPPSGLWKRWRDHKWKEQPDVIITCPDTRLTSSPKFVQTDPLPGSKGVDPENFELVFYFDRPVTYGHWSSLHLKEVGGSERIVVDPEDPDVRGRILLRDTDNFKMTFKPPESLKAGTTYSLILETGVFTDLQYNPSPPIVDGDFIFTTFGAPCDPYPSVGHVRVWYDGDDVESEVTSYPHGSDIEIGCMDNYSPKFSHSEMNRLSDVITFGTTYPTLTPTRLTVHCHDGEWNFFGLRCKAMCRQYQPLGTQYEVSVIQVSTDDGLLPFNFNLNSAANYAYMKDGSQLNVKCAETSEATNGSPLGETTTCQDGRWSPIALRCGATCGAFPSLGPGYRTISTDQSVKIGSYRIIACNDDVAQSGQERLNCLENGWEQPSLSCHYSCEKQQDEIVGHENGLVKVSALASNTPSSTAYQDGFVYTCAPGTIPQLSSDAADLDMGSYEEAFWNATATVPLKDDQVVIACFEGIWKKSKPLTCQKSCSEFSSPGGGYESRRILGDGFAPGTTYELTCKNDAVAQYTTDNETMDTVTCLRGSWRRLTHNIICFGSCKHPSIYFGSNYAIRDYITGNRIEAPVSKGLSFKHHSTQYRLECSTDVPMQPLSGPLLSSPDLLTYYDIDSHSTLALDPGSVISIPTLFERPSQTVTCDDGRWLPATHEITTASLSLDLVGAVRCSPFCGSLSHPSHARYKRSDHENGIGWGSRRRLTCASGFAGQTIVRQNGVLKLIERSQVQLECLYGQWIAPSPVTTIPGSSVTPAPNGDGMVVLPRAQNISSAELRYNIVHALTCAAGCTKKSLELLVSKKKLKITKPLKSRIPKSVDHAFLVEVTCEKGYERLSGPSSDFIACSDSEWSQPLLVCGKASCSDMVQNQGESDVDCGGPCSTDCTAAPCETTGDCEACGSEPTGFDPETVIYTLESGSKLKLGKYLDMKSALPLAHGTIVHAHLNESLLLPVRHQPSMTYLPFECVDGSWSPLKIIESLGVQQAVCDDKVMGRGEWGVDCGGFCPNDCPECVDGLVNGDEEWIDCGGSACAPCGSCSNNDLKHFTSENYLIQVVKSPLSLTSTKTQIYNASLVTPTSENWRTASVAHGAQRRISCASDSGVVTGAFYPLDLVCLNTRWWPMDKATDAISAVRTGAAEGKELMAPRFSLTCDTKDRLQLQSAAFSRFKPLPPDLTLPFCTEATAPADTEAHYCCDLIAAWMELLAGECGALIYGGNNVDAFCQGVCATRIQQLSSFYSERRRIIMAQATASMTHQQYQDFQQCQEMSSYIEALSTYFCIDNKDELTTRQNNASSTSPLRSIKSSYCFSQAPATLSQIRNFNVYSKTEDLQIICHSDSCFRSNLNYFATLWDMLSTTTFTRSGSSARRRLYAREGQSPIEAHIHKVYQALSESEAFLARARDSMVSLLSEDTDDTEPHFVMATARRRRLLSSQQVFNNPNDLKFNPSIVNLMCLQNNKGETCAPYLQQLSWGIEKLAQGPGSEEIGQIAASLSSICMETCFLQISRHLGQQLSVEATESSDPYKRFFGTLLKLYGRYYCQEDNQGNSCAVKYLGRLLQGFTDSERPPASDPIRSLPSCDSSVCPLDYVNDGVCDPACFTDVCAFDGKDCFVATMFSSVFKRLAKTLSPLDACHPLNQDFKSCKKHSTCYNKIKDVLLRDGCCFAVGMDIMKELLDLEFFSHPILRGDKLEDQFIAQIRSLVFPNADSRVFANSGNFSLNFYDNYKPDRSSIYPQILCNLFVDRTCSRGLSRRVLDLQFVTPSIPFDAMQWILPTNLRLPIPMAEFPADVSFPDFQEAVTIAAPFLRLALFLRKKLADLFALPIADIRDIQVWPDVDSGGTLIHLTVDPGQFADELLRAMQLAHETSELENAIVAAQQLWRSGLVSPIDELVDYYAMNTNAASTRLLQAEETLNILEEYAAADVNQMPTVTITNIYFGERDLDSVRASASLIANYSGGDPLIPVAGTFDIGDLDVEKASCPDYVYLGTQKLLLNSYVIVGAMTSKHGSKIDIQCKNDLSPARDIYSQSLTCANGRWITTDKTSLMTCHASCPEFKLPPQSLLQSTGVGGVKHGSTRTVSCSAGYQAVSGGPTQKIVCQDGEWTPVTLECQKTVLFDATCGGVALEPLASVYRFSLVDVMSSSTVAWWKATCQRGYERDTGTEPLNFVCMDDARLFIFAETSNTLSSFMLQSQEQTDVVDSALRQWIADGVDIGQVAQVDLARLPWSSTLPLRTSTGRLPLSPEVTLTCKEAVIANPQLLEETGIDDWTYIALVASMAIGVTLLFAAWGYFWQVVGRKKREQRKLRKLERKLAENRRARGERSTSEEFEDLDNLLTKPGAQNQFPSTQDTELPPLVSDVEEIDRSSGDAADWHHVGGRNENLLFETATSQPPLTQAHGERLGAVAEGGGGLQPRSSVNYLAVQLQQRRQQMETGSSANSYYSDLELFAHQPRHPETVIPNSSPQATATAQPGNNQWRP